MGLWLPAGEAQEGGDGHFWVGGRALRQEAQVAPRGAAQAVYREETRVMRDPARTVLIDPQPLLRECGLV